MILIIYIYIYNWDANVDAMWYLLLFTSFFYIYYFKWP